VRRTRVSLVVLSISFAVACSLALSIGAGSVEATLVSTF
jgi:hypothetical protein